MESPWIHQRFPLLRPPPARQAGRKLGFRAGSSGTKASQLFEKLGSAVGEMLAVASSGRMNVHRMASLPATYVSEHVAALAGLFDRPDRFSVTLRPASSSERVSIPRIDLLRVLTNLVRNAEQASRKDEGVELAVGLETIKETAATYGNPLGPGMHVVFQILDSGCGFDPETLPAALPSSPGRSGIGLEVTVQLLEEAGGGLRIHRRKRGSTMVEALVPICG